MPAMPRHSSDVTQRPPLPHSREEIGRRLKATRQALGLRARDIHRATGITESAWSQYEKGRRFPNLIQILPFADRFGIPLDWIYRGIVAAVPYEIAQHILDAQSASSERLADEETQLPDS
jgi:transcriptional regulator with XRE-family HTH domain